ncbi:probable Dolichyl-phosphate-mannose--protein mannosyltransferase 4 [Saccharomycodes ludwigii]|uniref:Dolichyl-phosphate-mannose--protein mannosyltransferase n=1 Tax=Saccharomycodes ludwigii TaxID=36035 RepID=A0A376B1W9_9ASCO|nr:probable Dolichyl-phosphate-mannose--protein mannosyltransferase 4 [Saccharomycodes ludwigii]
MGLNHRKKSPIPSAKPVQNNQINIDDDSKNKYIKKKSSYDYLATKYLLQSPPDSQSTYNLYCGIVTLIAFIARFYLINYPKEVVFDEVHFGKFASYYLERTYFFDLHPPFAKMLIAFIGYILGYDGKFKFDEIGMSYDTNPAPYIAYRSLNAIMGTLTVTFMFNTLKELNFKAITCALGAFLVAVDNAHVTETRLILLDATLIFSIASSIYCFVRFYKEQLREAFTKAWFLWLYLTGISLSFVTSTKYVGILTFATIGIAIVFNLWQLFDIKAGLTLKEFSKHFLIRLHALIVVPFIIYLFWFYVHFSILTKSGPGDEFMSPEFQETLGESPLARDSRDLNYFDVITLKHLSTDAFLHSHLANYPLRYEDGRISSQGQQVTGYSFEDVNNEWEVVPTKELPAKLGQPVAFNDVIRLRHIATNTYLLGHDVASPLYPTNEEITTVPPESANGENFQETLFRLEPLNKNEEGTPIRTKASRFRVIHVDTNVALWTHNDVLLPDWGFDQQEVNGNKKITDPENTWFFDQIINIPPERDVSIKKTIKPMNFFRKWWEAQTKMFYHNNHLTSEHPFASDPQSWPGSLSGVSFWNKDQERKQIYFIGNIIGWWAEIATLSLFCGIVLADVLTRRRSVYTLGKIPRARLYGPLMFLFIGWSCHFLPFFLMSRQKFLHHYLPAHMIAAMFTAALIEWGFTNNKSLDSSKDEELPEVPYEEHPAIKVKKLTFVFVILALAVFAFFIYFSPLVYGNVGLTPAEAKARQWLNIELHFTK